MGVTIGEGEKQNKIGGVIGRRVDGVGFGWVEIYK